MAQPCKVCNSPLRRDIERGFLTGTPLEQLARQFDGDVSKFSVWRHVQHHVTPELRRLWDERSKEVEKKEPADLDGVVLELQEETRKLRQMAEDRSDVRAALLAIREETRLVELYGKLTGAVRPREQPVNAAVLISDDHASRIYDSMLDRFVSDPEMRKVLEQKLGIAPAIETTAKAIKPAD